MQWKFPSQIKRYSDSITIQVVEQPWPGTTQYKYETVNVLKVEIFYTEMPLFLLLKDILLFSEFN